MILDLFELWWRPLAVGIAAVLGALLFYDLSRPVVERMSRRSTVLDAITARLHRPLHWVLPILALQVVWQTSAEGLPGNTEVQHLNVVLLIAALTATVIAAIGGVADAIGRQYRHEAAENLQARRIVTQTRVLSRIGIAAAVFTGLAFVLMTFPRARQYGTSLLASAGVSALVIGIAARSVLGNLLAGLQIAISQPIRIDDVLIIENEWGRVEDITGTYVVLKIWDERRLVIPLQWFIEHPFQNWTRTTSQIIGSVHLWVDFGADVEALRSEARRLAQASKDFDGRVCVLQVVEAGERAMQLRLIVSSASAGQSWDLRCHLREGLVAFLGRTQPDALPRMRTEVERSASMRRATASPTPDWPGWPGEAAAPVNDRTGMASLTAPTRPETPPIKTGGPPIPSAVPPVPPA